MRLLVAVGCFAIMVVALHAQEIGWSAIGGDLQGTRYSPATTNHP